MNAALKQIRSVLVLALCMVAFGIQAQTTNTQDVTVTSKKVDSSRKQFFVHNKKGTLLETGFYYANKPDLTWTQYDENGKRLLLAQFQNGVKHGTWYIWDEEGYLRYEIHYLNNTIQHAFELDRNGTLVASR